MVLRDFPSMASDVNTRRRAEEPGGDAETVTETADFIQLNQLMVSLISTSRFSSSVHSSVKIR